jgi:hypothetical protein
MHHALWATPLDPVYDTIIAQLAEVFKTPRFPAHVTILEGFESAENDERFASLAAAPFELVFERVVITDQQAIVLEASPSDAYASLACEAHERFAGTIPERIHLSLVYLPDDPEAVRALIERSFSFPLTIKFRRLERWDTKGSLSVQTINEWTIIARKSLN